jgi:hypothetical protein
MDDLNDKLKTGIGEANVDFLEINMQNNENWKAPCTESSGGGGKKEGADQVKPPVMVSVDATHLGNQYTGKGTAFNLANIFSPEPMLGADKYTRVYFRTESGNIYALNNQGQLINGNKSKEQGTWLGSQLDPKQAENSAIEIGKPFRYGEQGETEKVTEIVAVTDRRYSPDYLQTLSGGKQNTIIDELTQRGEPPSKETSSTVQEHPKPSTETTPRKVKSFKTAKGSEYTYDQDGKTTRFKTATDEKYERQDITVFANLTPVEEQDFLRYVNEEDEELNDELKVKVYAFERQQDDTPKILKDISEVKYPDRIYLGIAKNGKVIGTKQASLQPFIGASVFDTRQFKDASGQTKTARHLGNKVVDIQYENN